MTTRRLEIFIIVTIIAVIGIVYAMTQKPVIAPVVENTNQNQNQGIAVGEPNPSAPVEYKGEDGKNAMELLKAKYTVEVKSYSFGEMVTGINGITPDANHFWALYVNGEMSQVGAAQYVTKDGDSIVWKLDEIKM